MTKKKQTTKKENETPKPKHKVAIIGAGVAGCATAGALQDYGIDFEVFDMNGGPGGLWADNYPGASGKVLIEGLFCLNRLDFEV